jgi:2,3-bisphosphoglycerate-independent phosphoglycerate mutase
MTKDKVLLLILDGVGINKEYTGNAVYLSKTKNLDTLINTYPYTELGASEQYVGLDKGQLGGSEVGHLTIGAGKVVLSDLTRINKAIKEKSFYKNKILLSAFSKVKKGNALHLIGLLSDGGVHSHMKHLFALLDVVKQKNLPKVFIHVFSDGRDTHPKSILTYLSKLKEYISKLNLLDVVEIASISGRFYGMDRDNRWDRLEKVYSLLVEGKGNFTDSKAVFIKQSYRQGITDEYFIPTLFDKDGLIKNKDTIIYFNFRSDRAREFTRLFVDKKFKIFKTKKLDINFYTLTQYDSTFKNINVVFPPLKVNVGLGQIISKAGFKQLRAAETEKYAHVTYFFNQGQEFPNKGETRIVVPSPKVLTYDLKPKMSLLDLMKKLIPEVKKNYKLMVVNFANGDMVGHTGNLSAAITAIETMDNCVLKLLKAVDKNTTVIITADHGNCDEMSFSDRSISTSHSLSKVPFILVSDKFNLNKIIKKPSLANIAPTILDILDIKKPKNMAQSLLKK